MAATKQEQYRPSFTLSELEDFLLFLPETCPTYNKLAVYVYKVKMGLNAAAYASAPKVSLVESLGGELPEKKAKDSAAYTARLQQRAELAPTTLTAEDRYNLLAAKAMAAVAEDRTTWLTEVEIEEGKRLEQELYGMELGTFA